MACGVPVVAAAVGVNKEIIEDGVSGFIVDTIDEAVAAVGKIDALNRRWVRKCFERRFTVERMARDYVTLYNRLAATHRRVAEGVRRDDGTSVLEAVA
jgi:glycosyltransferase involved in cell wall biosynthesis